MTPLARKALLLNLLTQMRTRGSWCGETHIQKSTYVAQVVLNIPFEFEFILYKYGPFSFELRDELVAMRADDFLQQVSQYPYGTTLVPGPLAETLTAKFPKTLKKYGAKLQFVAAQLSRYTASELERIATALFVTRSGGQKDVNSRTQAISALKPHISREEAIEAVKLIDELVEAARGTARP